MRSAALLDCPQHVAPFRPRGRRSGVSRLSQQIAAIEQETRIDVPRHPIGHPSMTFVCQMPGKVIAGVDHGRLHGIERVERDELRQPSVAELGDVG